MPASEGSASSGVGAQRGGKGRLARFAEWRRGRPFVPGLLVLLSGVVIMTPAYLTVRISDLLVMISTLSGVSTLFLGVAQIMFGLGIWLKPSTSVYLGVFAILLSLVALPASNIGGFLLGSLLGIFGGAFALAWEPGDGKRKKAKATAAEPAELAESAESAESTGESVGDGGDGADGDAPQSGGGYSATVAALLVAVGIATGVGILNANAPYSAAQPARVGDVGQVTADNVTFKGNVRISVDSVGTEHGRRDLIRITGDRLQIKNLQIQLPGQWGDGMLRTGSKVETYVVEGPVVVEATSLEAVPALAEISTIPVKVDISGSAGDVLHQLGLVPSEAPIPDPVMEVVSLKQVKLDLLHLTGRDMNAPVVHLKAL
ncbi:DUF6114 domain-containing protein [Corynebacterium jeikeium]|jgi:hypothetical protein|uniref:Putative membrane protein n=1 Tax=Corynebacterium jeikeium (strain K411) TaxID=306537 RepID=Q4JSH2_CORJK|nr:DUF6114 domain-containing protein [Corynebacterium jeikeium]EEW15660.1 hypothetical protein HMPREF0297_1959 [Corynebacterium jeikeium ATCC 43734]OOD34705.1 hypothetical protein BWP03_00135 [Corynebacterium jeikeium]WCZ54707.1 hypothetical protein CJEIK_11130 [Corynebacterium jeikeium]CAI38235.1 putative membrane protein [Corynebacterium jeikeium K411]SUY82191.1 putative secreted protein [Corynebacterium jeikeium]